MLEIEALRVRYEGSEAPVLEGVNFSLTKEKAFGGYRTRVEITEGGFRRSCSSRVARLRLDGPRFRSEWARPYECDRTSLRDSEEIVEVSVAKGQRTRNGAAESGSTMRALWND